MKIIKNVKPRNYFHISNKYIINNKSYNDDFIINIYYIHEKKIYLIIRKINNMDGWDYNINIKINDSITNNHELFMIGSSNKNFKKINLFSKKIIFEKKKEKILSIPKVIFQTNKNRYFDDDLAYNSINSFIEFNPQYEYLFFNNIECREFIKNNFNHVFLYYYDLIYPGAFKADYFRYCYLYIKGGCYFDSKSILLQSLDDLINEDDNLILCQDNHKFGLYNAIIIAKPYEEIFYNLLNTINYKINNFKNIYKPNLNYQNFIQINNILSLTGPNLLYEVFKKMNYEYDDHVLMKHNVLGNMDNYKNLIVNFNDKLLLYKNYKTFSLNNPNHYSDLWKKKKIFYTNYTINSNNYFLLEPNNLNIKLEFYFLYNKILIISNMNINNPIDFILIDENSNVKDFTILNMKNNHSLIEYENFIYNKYYQSIEVLENDKIKSNCEFSINKILNDYFLIIYNPNNINLLNIDIKINMVNNNQKRYKVNIFNHNFYNIKKISYLFNI